MTDHMMTCEEYDELLPLHLEDELSVEQRDRVERHLATCRRCWAERDELLDVARTARELPTLSPPRDLWAGIAERIQTPVIALDTGEHAVPERVERGGHWMRLAAAAAALIIATAGMTFAIAHRIYAPEQVLAGTGGQPDTAAEPVSYAAPVQPSLVRLVTETDQLGSADAAYAREIADLRATLDRRRPQLDSATLAIVERTLAMIDTAIAQTKAAIKKNPESAMLGRQLDRALGKKVDVLRRAVLLPVTAD